MNKKMFILGIVCLVLGTICFSTGLYMYLNVDKNNIETDNSNLISMNSNDSKNIVFTKGIDLTKPFEMNSIEIINVIGNEKRTIKDYPQISGLKDKNIENKINLKLKKIYEENYTDKEHGIHVSANFANILSIAFEDNYVNIDLNTGNDITLDQVFNDNVSVTEIIRNQIYTDIVLKDETKYQPNYDTVNIEVSDAYDKFVYNKKFKFLITNNVVIIVNDNDDQMNIEFKNFHDKIAIYDRFSTDKSIYETNLNDGVKLLPLMHEKYSNDDYSRYNGFHDNIIAHIVIKNVMLSGAEPLNSVQRKNANKIYETVLTKWQEKIDEFKKMKPEENKLDYIYQVTIDKLYQKAVVIQMETENKEYMTEEYFVETWIPNNFTTYNEGFWWDYDTDFTNSSVKIKSQINNLNEYDTRTTKYTLYNLNTGAEIKEVGDIFVNGYDYKSVIISKIIEAQSKDQIDSMDANLIYNESKIIFDYNMKIKLIYKDKIIVTVELKEFEQDKLDIL